MKSTRKDKNGKAQTYNLDRKREIDFTFTTKAGYLVCCRITKTDAPDMGI